MIAEAGAGKPDVVFFSFLNLFRTSDLEIWHPSAAGEPQSRLLHIAILLQSAPSMACVPPGSRAGSETSLGCREESWLGLSWPLTACRWLVFQNILGTGACTHLPDASP